MKRSLSVILAALLLASCGGTAEPSAETTAAGASGDTTPAETAVDLYADLPTGDFGGYEFNILSINDPANYLYVQMTAEEMNGELINDTVSPAIRRWRRS